MDSRGGGCCIARYSNGRCDNSSSNYANVNRILLRYRPIAPKPVDGGTSLKSLAEESASKVHRGRRKGVVNDIINKENKSFKTGSRKRKVSVKLNPAMVTLQLLPESPVSGCSSESLEGGAAPEKNLVQGGPIWLSLDDQSNNKNIQSCNGGYYGGDGKGYGYGGLLEMKEVVRSCVKVESLAYTWLGDLNGLGRTDDEKVMSLEKDTCPGFISDGSNRVVWVNGAYNKMFGGGDKVAVWMDLGDGIELGGLSCGGFTCQVRVVTCGEGNGKNRSSSVTLPCDVWKMDFGGFAWRLDTKAALSLGR